MGIARGVPSSEHWPDDVSVAVNVSTKQFTHPGLSSTIFQALSASGLAPHRLELEITESIFIRDVKKSYGNAARTSCLA